MYIYIHICIIYYQHACMFNNILYFIFNYNYYFIQKFITVRYGRKTVHTCEQVLFYDTHDDMTSLPTLIAQFFIHSFELICMVTCSMRNHTLLLYILPILFLLAYIIEVLPHYTKY